MDVDGTLTDGGIYLDDHGREFKRFDASDGFGINMWHRAGGLTAVITGRKGLALTHRMLELSITAVEQGVADKIAALDRIAASLGVQRSECVFIGDDIPDLAVMRVVGVAVAVASSASEVIDAAAMTTVAKGGHGAVRELIETILRADGRWQKLIASLPQ